MENHMMNRIVMHHTAGAYSPNAVDRKAYHRLIDGGGIGHNGLFPINANAPGKIREGAYAAHTRNLNTGSIGVAICAMANADWHKPFDGSHPVKPAQVDGLVREVAALCRAYGIDVTGRTVLSHAEVEPTLGVTQRGKWDFDYHPRGGASRDPVAIGDDLRDEVLRAMGGRSVAPVRTVRATIRQGARGSDVALAQAGVGANPDGVFGPMTRAAVVRFQRREGLLPDGIVGPMTWAEILKP